MRSDRLASQLHPNELRHWPPTKAMTNIQQPHLLATTIAQSLLSANIVSRSPSLRTLPKFWSYTPTHTYQRKPRALLSSRSVLTPIRTSTTPATALRAAFHTHHSLTMSDSDYAAFLDKANQDTGSATAQSSKKVGTKSVNTAVPKALEQVEEYYTSDADEPFEPVALEFDGDNISAGKSTACLRTRGWMRVAGRARLIC